MLAYQPENEIDSIVSSPNKESKPLQGKNSDDSYPQRTEAETDLWSPELSNNNDTTNLNNTADENSKDGDDGFNTKKLHKKKKKSKMDVTKSDKKKVSAVKGKRETDESIMQDH